ncbi:DUF397 domain-containing protein [Streptomyces sp. NRRL S-1868]|uniref:DUF397 domain-containing protein n=1 Tax=Streptomyces sp. NRRL S-1868 TaxID=1463892 RepID=UPI0004C658EB|nr:DUF397 domain-containing protein [Streptomyces sp. NRRL S-1868]
MISANSVLSVAWRKSSYSGQGGGNCLEVGDGFAGPAVPVRDSKRPEGPALLIPAGAWRAFTAGLHTGGL